MPEDDLAAKTGAVLRSPVAFPLSLDTPRSLIRVECTVTPPLAVRRPIRCKSFNIAMLLSGRPALPPGNT